MYFSWSPRKVPKEGDSRGYSEKASNNSGMIATSNHCYFKFAARSTTPEETPAPHRQPTPDNVPIFRRLQRENLQVFEM